MSDKKFNDPRWDERRAAKLAESHHLCAECEQRAEKVLIAYWPSSVQDPWDLPGAALKAYCVDHYRDRRKIQEDLRKRLAAFTVAELDSIDRALGVLAGITPSGRAVICEGLYVDAKNRVEEHNSAA